MSELCVQSISWTHINTVKVRRNVFEIVSVCRIHKEGVRSCMAIAADQLIVKLMKFFYEACKRCAKIVVTLPHVLGVIGNLKLDGRREFCIILHYKQLGTVTDFQ